MVRSQLRRLPSVGYWWLPENEDDKHYGQLEGEPGRIKLTLADSFDGSHRRSADVAVDYFDSLPQVPVVHGVINGTLVSLLGLRTVDQPVALPGLPQTIYSPESLVFGRWVDLQSENGPIGVQVRFTGLLYWLGHRGLTQTIQVSADQTTRRWWTYNQPDAVKWRVGDFDIELGADAHQQRAWDSLVLEEYGYFQVESATSKSLRAWIEEVINPLHEMLKLAFLSPVHLVGSQFKWDLGGTHRDDWGFETAELVLNRRSSPDEERKLLRQEDFLFLPNDLSDESLAKLLALTSRVSQIRSKSLRYEETPQLRDDHFLNSVRQLESLHRVLYPVSEQDKLAFQERLKSIYQVLNEADAKLVSGRLRYGFDPSLARRLRALAMPWRDDLTALFGTPQRLSVEFEK